MSCCFVMFNNDPENYPPTYNAICALSDKYVNVHVFYRVVNKKRDLRYPPNVMLYNTGFTDNSIKNKLLRLPRYTGLLTKNIKIHNPRLILIFDELSLLLFCLFLPKTGATVWFHSHDVFESKTVSVFNVNRIAFKSLPYCFKKIDFFSLPAVERLQYYPVNRIKGGARYSLLPNYPSLRLFGNCNNLTKTIDKEVRLLYQGTLGNHHGFEELIPLLGSNGKYVYKLTLVGNIKDEYKLLLLDLAKKHGTGDFLAILKPVSYIDLRSITKIHSIGLAIHKPENIIYSTGGTASNKIYEYITYGLPVVLFDSPHYRAHLKNEKWAFFTDTSAQSLLNVFNVIVDNYDFFSAGARESFLKKLNYEVGFKRVFEEAVTVK